MRLVSNLAAKPIFSFIALLLTALSFAVAFVFPISAAEPAPKSPTASVPTAEKGGWQVIDTPYGPLSFVEIQKHPKKDEILTWLKPSKQARFNEWEQQAAMEWNKWKLEVQQAAIKEGEKIDAGTQAAIKEGEKIDAGTQAAMEKLRSQTPELITKMELLLKKGWKLRAKEEKKTLELIISLGEPKDWIEKAKEIYNNPRNFA